MQTNRRRALHGRPFDPPRSTTAVTNQPMATYNTRDEERLGRSELAWELVELFGELQTEQINEVLAKNVPMETLEFFTSYAEDFGHAEGIGGKTSKRLPNLLLLGYLLRVLEDRLIENEPFDD
jgi:hypothetical protein